MRAEPMAVQGIAYFNFIARATPDSPPARISFSLHQDSLLEELPRLQRVARMLSPICMGSIDDPVSYLSLRDHLSDFFHQTIQQRNGLGVRFFIHLFFQKTMGH